MTWAVAAVGLAAGPSLAPAAVSAVDLRVESRVDPLGIDAAPPRLSWVVDESDPAVRGQRQTGYQVQVAPDAGSFNRAGGDRWDSGRVASAQTDQLTYAGPPLSAGQRCAWRVRVWDKDGQPSPWSRPAAWSAGLLAPADWRAQWIGGGAVADPPTAGPLRPPLAFRKPFDARGPVARATLSAAAAGAYDLVINGQPVTADVLAPGWTQFDKRVYYRTYDVTPLVRGGGPNVIAATVGDGWFGLHHDGRGDLALRLQLDIEYADGTRQTVGTDPSWRVSAEGPTRSSDLYQGEAYDARREQPGWDRPGFDDGPWAAAAPWRPVPIGHYRDVTAAVRGMPAGGKMSFGVDNADLGQDPVPDVVKTLRLSLPIGNRSVLWTAPEAARLDLGWAALLVERAAYGAGTLPPDVTASVLQAHPGPPVRRWGELRTVGRSEPRPGAYVYDLGQNFTGWARLRASAPAGTIVTLRFAEVLDPDGSVYTANLRRAACTDRYTFAGRGTETWEPRFTYHGFRYVEVTGLPARPADDAVTGIVVSSDAPLASSFSCSDPLVNQLQHNIVWGQRSNYFEVPTDCPQRDERLGWAGDAQAFLPTGTYNQDLAAFFTAWLRTYDDAQSADGAFPAFAPLPSSGNGSGWNATSPAWGDAGVICPWTLYQVYRDGRVLADGYPHMARWVDYLNAHSHDGGLRPAEGFGDWLSIRADTPKDLIATAYFARVTGLVADAARALHRDADAAKYGVLRDGIRAAFVKAYVTAGGHVKGETQTGYLLALGFDLLPAGQRTAAADHLCQLIADRHDHLSVGFLGVNLLLPVLTDTGHTDLVYRLLEADTYPSWGYPIRQGATTVWERWNGYTREQGFADAGMNSFNHYAYGSCGQWMFATLAGIAPGEPGYGSVVVHPRPGGGVTFADARYDSPRGPVGVHWGLTDGGHHIRLDVTVPANVTATVYVPAKDAAAVTEGDGPAARSPGVRFVRAEPGFAVYAVGGGRYAFGAALP